MNLNDRTRSSGIRDLFGLLNDLLQRFDWGLEDRQVSFKARYAFRQPLRPSRRRD